MCSCKANVRAIPCNHHTQYFDAEMGLKFIVGQLIPCAEGLCRNETMHSKIPQRLILCKIRHHIHEKFQVSDFRRRTLGKYWAN